MDRRVTPPKRVIPPTWGPPPPLLTVPQTVSTFPTVEPRSLKNRPYVSLQPNGRRWFEN